MRSGYKGKRALAESMQALHKAAQAAKGAAYDKIISFCVANGTWVRTSCVSRWETIRKAGRMLDDNGAYPARGIRFIGEKVAQSAHNR